MTHAERTLLLANFHQNPPADIAAIRQFESISGILLQKNYVEFLLATNGGEGFVGNAYIMLWRIEELLSKNKDYEVVQDAPELFLFGSDGGGEAFAFDLRSDAITVVSVPFIGMALEYAHPKGENFDQFLINLFIASE